MLSVLVILLGLGLAVLLLPVLVAVEVERPGLSEPVGFRLSWGFLLGGAGLQLRFRDQAWYLHPLILGRHLPFPRWRLREAAAGAEAPLSAGEASLPGPAPQSEAAPDTGLREAPKRAAAPAAPLPEFPAAAAPPPPAPKPSGRAGRLAGEALRPGLRLLRRLGRTFRLRRLRLEGSFGLEDPAATGQLFGYLQGARGLLPGRLHLELRPDFVHQGVRGRARLAIHFYLGRALYLVSCFAVWLAWRWWALRKAARRRPPLRRGDN